MYYCGLLSTCVALLLPFLFIKNQLVSPRSLCRSNRWLLNDSNLLLVGVYFWFIHCPFKRSALQKFNWERNRRWYSETHCTWRGSENEECDREVIYLNGILWDFSDEPKIIMKIVKLQSKIIWSLIFWLSSDLFMVLRYSMIWGISWFCTRI